MQNDNKRSDEGVEERQFEEYTQYWVLGCDALFGISEKETRRWAKDLKSAVPFHVIFNDLPSDYLVQLIVESDAILSLQSEGKYDDAYLRVRNAFYAAERSGVCDVDWDLLCEVLDKILADYGTSLASIRKTPPYD